MNQAIRDRVYQEADYIIVYHTTIEKTAEHFGVSTSTVHYDVTQRLPELSKGLAQKVRRVLNYNIAQRSIRGGRATSEKKKSQ